MSDNDTSPNASGGSNTPLLVVAGLYLIASLYMGFNMYGRISSLEQAQATTTTQYQELTTNLDSAQARIKAATENFAETLGATKEEMDARAAQLQKQQRAAVQRLAKQQKEQLGAVAGEVEGVKTEVGNVKTDVASTRTDLEVTKERLQRATGDLGMQSGLIARTREELEVLKRRGERNYYEFALFKNAGAKPVSTISLQLKKSDPKRSKFTVNVIADDHVIEKKDRTLLEPLQFYTGRDRQLYEVVVFEVSKNKISGYLSTPKESMPGLPVAKAAGPERESVR